MVNTQQVVTTTYPDLGTRIETYQRDGKMQSVGGTAAYPEQYQYGVARDPFQNWWQYTLDIKLNSNNGTNEWTRSFTDNAGRVLEVLYPGSTQPLSVSSYNTSVPGGQLISQADPDGVTTLFAYDAKGNQVVTAVDIEQTGSIDYGGVDRITMTTNDVTFDNGAYVTRTQTFVWATNNAAAATLVATHEVCTNGIMSWDTVWNNGLPVTSKSVTCYGANGQRWVTNTAADGSYTVSLYSYGLLSSVTKFASGTNQIAQMSYGYDTHGRQNTITDARNGTTTYYFNNADQVCATLTPPPASGQGGELTTNFFDGVGRVIGSTLPDNTCVTNVYYPTGLRAIMYGSRMYPVGYGYDAQGRVTAMTNWSNFNGGAGARVTTWNYDPNRGWLANKVYSGGAAGPSYGYTPAGRLSSRAWARGVTTAYAYDNGGILTNIAYSDSTPSVTNTYDRRGRLSTAAWNGITDTLAYDSASDLLGESFSGGALNGLSVTNGYDQFLRRTNLTALSSSAPSRSIYGYDNASRLSSVTDGNGNTAAYSYLANSSLVGQIGFTNTTVGRMTTTKQYDYLNRLTQISSQPGAAYTLPLAFNYSYNPANQRTKDTLADGSYWVYVYDSLGQVTNGCKFFANGTPVPGQQFDYTFDNTRPVRYGKFLLRLRFAQSDRWQPLRWPHAGFAQPFQAASGGRGAVNKNAPTV